ncbi:glycoside hydrolase family 43 protein [Exiguobacterium flavidum]|uniref:glycoside hydrolase family 43 protein n=1 Tax=Exiguobacterium flavidum TaxID=2184695 RepID=UPI000DF72F23|nr:glycoside hydrolase family 43 protein [Exiguobacterium flavidum]
MRTTHLPVETRERSEIHMRDPFVFPDASTATYYLYGTTCADGIGDIEPGFHVYTSTDLKAWTGPYLAFDPPVGFWGVRHYWAPEVHAVDGAYWMLATCKGRIGVHRGTTILRSDHPAGPYVPLANQAATPPDEEALDGTLHTEDGRRFLVYCHEWTQLHDGEIKAVELKDGRPLGAPFRILRAGTQSWIRKFRDPRIQKDGYLTDAPFLYRARNGDLLLFWSSYADASITGGAGGYTVAVTRSTSGSIFGPWTEDEALFLDKDAGHSSLFRTFQGELMLCTHSPDTPHGMERPAFFNLTETDDGLRIHY